MTRLFTDDKAVRGRVPLMLGLIGPSGSGKTKSALRLATGIRSVVGGEIFVVDTEARRALEFADEHEFRHVPFSAPFGPQDYLAAITYCKERGATIIIVDSTSHEHEGPGGVLEQHAAEVQRLSKGDPGKVNSVKMLAWAAPKAARRALIQGVIHLGVNLILCFRAKEKIKPQKGKDPQELGWMPIAGPEFVYEMQACALLLPGSQGRPTWQPAHEGEKQMVKLPGFARGMFSEQLDEATGERLALWAQGSKHPMAERMEAAEDAETVAALEQEIQAIWRTLDQHSQRQVQRAGYAARERLGMPALNGGRS